MTGNKQLRIETEREDDGRWIAEVLGLDVNGVIAYGSTEDEARRKVEALALEVIAERAGYTGITEQRGVTHMHDAFAVHMLNEDGKVKAQLIAKAFDVLLADLSKACPVGREMAIVITKLEEAAFFAKKAMAKQPENQQ